MIKTSGWVSLDFEMKDEGPPGYDAGSYTLTCRQIGVVSIDDVKDLPGKEGEIRKWETTEGQDSFGNYSKEEWEAFLKDLETNGIQSPIFITVAKDGSISVSEGNHRIQAALQLDFSTIPVEVAYYGNSQKEFSFPN